MCENILKFKIVLLSGIILTSEKLLGSDESKKDDEELYSLKILEKNESEESVTVEEEVELEKSSNNLDKFHSKSSNDNSSNVRSSLEDNINNNAKEIEEEEEVEVEVEVEVSDKSKTIEKKNKSTKDVSESSCCEFCCDCLCPKKNKKIKLLKYNGKNENSEKDEFINISVKKSSNKNEKSEENGEN